MVSDTHKLPARGPMPWNDTENNGFTSAKPWLNGISQDDVTVANEVNSDNSMFTFYKNMLNLKKEKLFQDGTYYMISTGKDSYVYQRDLGNESAIVAVSLSNKKISIDLPEEYIKELLKAGEYQLTNGKLTLMPYTGVVLKKEN